MAHGKQELVLSDDEDVLDERMAALMEERSSLLPEGARAATPQPAAPAQDASGLQKAGELTTGAGAAGANPYVAGAGMAMQGIAAIDQAKRSQEQAKIDAYNQKIMAERAAIRNLFA